MNTAFSTFDVSKLLGIDRGRIREWIDKDFITPSIEKSKGQGKKNLFSLLDVYGIVLFTSLLNMGLSREKASSFFHHFVFHAGTILKRDIHEYKFIVYYFNALISGSSGIVRIHLIPKDEDTSSSLQEVEKNTEMLVINIDRILEVVDSQLNKEGE